MKQTERGNVPLPTRRQVEKERKRYRRQKAYNKALGGTVYVLTIVAAVAVLIATLILPVLQIEGTSPDRLDLGTNQFDTGFEFFLHEVFVIGFPVPGHDLDSALFQTAHLLIQSWDHYIIIVKGIIR